MKENESLRGQLFVTEEGEVDGEKVDIIIFHGLIASLADRLFALVFKNMGKGNKMILHEDEVDLFEDLRKTQEDDEDHFESI